MNVVPISGPNTLPLIFDRGLIGVMHDWYEPSICLVHIFARKQHISNTFTFLQNPSVDVRPFSLLINFAILTETFVQT